MNRLNRLLASGLACLALARGVTGCMPDRRTDFDGIELDGDASADAATNDGTVFPETGTDAQSSENITVDVRVDVAMNDVGPDGSTIPTDVDPDAATPLDTGVDAADGGDATDVGGDVDSGMIITLDIPVTPLDTGTDVPRDLGTDTGPLDAGTDVGFDTGTDVPRDTGTDTGPLDVGFDTGPDVPAPVDTGTDVPRDLGTDTGPLDTGPSCPVYSTATLTFNGRLADGSVAPRMTHLYVRVAQNLAGFPPITRFFSDAEICAGGLTPTSGLGQRCTIDSARMGVLMGCLPWVESMHRFQLVPRADHPTLPTQPGPPVITSHDVNTTGAPCYVEEGRLDCLTINCGGVPYVGQKFYSYRGPSETDPYTGGEQNYISVTGPTCASSR